MIKDIRKKYKKHLVLGQHSYIAGDIHISCPWTKDVKIRIGKYCSLSGGINFYLGGNHRVDWISTFPLWSIYENVTKVSGHPATKGDIIIGNDVWIGQTATILSGVTIGDGAVIGAKAVVGSDVEPYSIVVGNPAKIVKKRFTKIK